ncbi:MAG: hypothetical protein HC836_43520 [Richelia sp. RM2_1_2]|nr:hypothetical protein [Richelia sp. SM1_7_0]NJN12939.1 hypothetical protein [Richelia sp. RM1_1_1]NJO28438.1 hypothetical protein [Richelia sp. SL_2_1]NJO64766.1 hypothetical protein [Richelia sp. RM2_1_2]
MKISQFIILKLIPIILASIAIYSSSSSAQSQTNLPTRTLPSEEGNFILLPDWQRISFNQMPAIQNGGSIKVNGFSRAWNAGDTPDKYLTLGDIDEALKPQLFSIRNITNEKNLKNFSLESFLLLGEQTVENLVEVIPNLGQTNAAKILPIATLLKTESPQININTSLTKLLSQNPTLRNLKLNQIDLSTYTISDIPNLDAVRLSNFKGWENALVKDIPGLSDVPLASFPLPLAELGNKVARIDFIWGTAEKRRQRTVSGSDVAGFSVPCQGEDCPHIELDDLENSGRNIRGKFEGSSWISGKYQKVEGGWGCLKSVNGGKEPTGRLPYGSAFKVAVMEPDEKTDTVDTALFFRFKNACGATPYFIGPVPFFTYEVNAPIFIGD